MLIMGLRPECAKSRWVDYLISFSFIIMAGNNNATARLIKYKESFLFFKFINKIALLISV